MAASRTGVVGVPSDVDVTCVLSFTSAFPTQRRWVMIKTNFQPKIGLKQPNALTQRSQPSIWVEKTTQRFLECALKSRWENLTCLHAQPNTSTAWWPRSPLTEIMPFYNNNVNYIIKLENHHIYIYTYIYIYIYTYTYTHTYIYI